MRIPVLTAFVLLFAMVTAPLFAEIPAPDAVMEVSVTERLGAQVPAHLSFRDSAGHARQLGAYFDGRTPVVLVLAYVKCETLCSLVLRGVAEAARAAESRLGRDFRVVTVSIDPRERPKDAAWQRAALLDMAGRPPNEPAWTALTGAEPAIRAVAEAVGFGYQWDERSRQFAHPAVVFVLSGRGQVMQYLYGARYPGPDLDAALAAARRGEATPTGDGETPIGCFRFDPAMRQHWSAIAAYYAAGGCLVLAASVFGIGYLIRRRRHSL